jgi:biotin carboxyl carrier protein
MLGTFYAAPRPGEPPYVSVGQVVKTGDPLGLIEVMKMMNSVVSDVDGAIVSLEVQNGSFVEYNQPLFTLRPADDQAGRPA